jgi:hypothetical protein
MALIPIKIHVEMTERNLRNKYEFEFASIDDSLKVFYNHNKSFKQMERIQKSLNKIQFTKRFI